MRILIRGGRLVDPSQGLDAAGNILIDDGVVVDYPSDTSAFEGDGETRIVDAAGKVVAPGFVDLLTNLCEPGYEHRETIRTGTMAAAAGGFTTVVCTPDTDPVNDNASVTDYILLKAKKEGVVNVLPLGALTRDNACESLAEIGEMREAGCVGVTDCVRPVMNARLMRLAMEYTKAFEIPVFANCYDDDLSAGGVMNESYYSTALGLRGNPAASEQIMVYRNIALAELTGARVHLVHISTAASVALIREAKARGVGVTASVAPHSFTIDESAVVGYDTTTKTRPPLRTQHDIEALLEGLSDGTIDAIASHHSPHSEDEIKVEFDVAPFGISALETALPLTLELVTAGRLSMMQLVERLSTNPARILSLEKGTLRVGSVADLVVFDDTAEYTIDSSRFRSKGANTPFDGFTVRGRVHCTVVGGSIVYSGAD